MDLMLGGTEPPTPPESWMKRYLKLLVVTLSLVAALLLTVTRRGPEGGFDLREQQSRAAPDRTGSSYDLTQLKVFTVVLGRVKEHYVDPARIKPKQMLIAALNAIEQRVAEVMVEESPKNDRVKIRVQDAERTFELGGVDSPWALSSLMKSIMRFMQPHLNKSTEIRDVEYAAINGLLQTLDPHSIVLKPEIYNEMKLSTRGEFGGLGIVISMIQGVLTVMNPMKGTPAYNTGIKSCDQILKIGEESTVNMTLSQAVARLRGAPGSKVEITLQREGARHPTRKAITRAVIKVDSVNSRMLAKKVGYVQLTSFQGNSFSDLRQNLRKLKRKGMRGLVLDLRGNPGGLLDQAIKISDLFIDTGTLLATVSHAGKQREEKRAKSEGTESRYPIAVLVDSGSASASEIVAGALKHLDRAVIIGTRTFGKGSVQVLYDNDDGSALKLTIAQYLTPGDISIQSVGITPDIRTVPLVARRDFVRLRRHDGIRREEDLREHLTSHKVRRNVKPEAEVHYVAARADKKKDKPKEPEPTNLCLFRDRKCEPSDEDKFVEDFQIKFARDLVAQASGWRRSQILGAAQTAAQFKRTEQEQEKQLVDDLSQLGVDWRAAPAGGEEKATLDVAVSGRRAKACEKFELKVSVTNRGKRPVYRLAGITKADHRRFKGHEFPFGRIDPGKSKSWVVPVRLRNDPNRTDTVTVALRDGAGNDYPPHSFQISTVGVQSPTFAYGYQLIDDTGNGDGKAQRGEDVRLLVKVRNTGPGRAFNAVTTLKNLAGLGVFIKKGRFVLGNLAPGESRKVSFTLQVQPSYEPSSFKVELGVADDGLNESVTDKLQFDVSTKAQASQAASGTVSVTVKRARFRAWAASDAPVVGSAPRGAGFKVVGRSKGWYRVEASKDRPAFVAAADVSSGGQAGSGRFSARWQVTPPKLTVHLPKHITDDAKVRISGRADDETRVSDLFIFVTNPGAKIEARKVFYRSNRHATSKKSLPFQADVPLWPGSNYVSVYARENDEVQANQTVVIYRKKDGTVAARSPKDKKSSTAR